MDFPTAARHNPAAVGQPARLINIFCINLMNSQSICTPSGWKSTELLQSICSQPVRKCDNCAGEGETHLLLPVSQACKPHHVSLIVPCSYPSRSKNTLLFHWAAWSLSCGYHLWDPQAEEGVLSERAYLGLRPCLTRFREKELLMAVLLHLVMNAALREVH